MKFIKVETIGGRMVHININQITTIQSEWNMDYRISFSDKDFILVAEEEWQRIYKIIYGDED